VKVSDGVIQPVIKFTYGGSTDLIPELYLKLYSLEQKSKSTSQPFNIEFSYCKDIARAVNAEGEIRIIHDTGTRLTKDIPIKDGVFTYEFKHPKVCGEYKYWLTSEQSKYSRASY